MFLASQIDNYLVTHFARFWLSNKDIETSTIRSSLGRFGRMATTHKPTGRPRKPDHQRRTLRVNIRVSAEELRLLHEQAEIEGLPFSRWVRQQLRKWRPPKQSRQRANASAAEGED